MDYKLMCFPCLRKKKKFCSSASSSTDLNDPYEYIVDKYTIRRIPLRSGIVSAESVRRLGGPCELEPKINRLDNYSLKEKDFRKIALAPGEVYSMPRVSTVLPVTTHSSRAAKEKPRPTDILDSNSLITRRPALKPNYVVIPSKASLHVKDIMLTKREITNQYLNNFSSVFVDNLKDQVPKDPQNFPKLSRPYTSAVKNLCIGGALSNRQGRRKGESCRNKVHKLVYSLPDGTVIETGCDPDEDVASDPTDDDYPAPVHAPNIRKKPLETISAPFKCSVRGHSSCSENDGDECRPHSRQRDAEATTSLKHITYEDIQALDVGYEFPNSEKYGVKPKMTRIRFTNIESDRSRELPTRSGYIYGIDSDYSRRSIDPFAVQSSKPHCQSGGVFTIKNQSFKSAVEPIPKNVSTKDEGEEDTRRVRYYTPEPRDRRPSSANPTLSTTLDMMQDKRPYHSDFGRRVSSNPEPEDLKRKMEAEKFSFIDLGRDKSGSKADTEYGSSSMELDPKFSESTELPKMGKSRMKGFGRPSSASSERSGSHASSPMHQTTGNYQYRDGINLYGCQTSCRRNVTCRSRSLESLTSARKEDRVQSSSKTVPFIRFSQKRIDTAETEASNSLYSRDSKTSSMVTSTGESDPEYDTKKATLRWKIIIKHHKDDSKGSGKQHRNTPK